MASGTKADERKLTVWREDLSLSELDRMVEEDIGHGPEGEPETIPDEGVLPPHSRVPQFFDPIAALGVPAPKPERVHEYDLATLLPISELQERGMTGTGRYLLYPMTEMQPRSFWEELKREVRALGEQDILLVRMDRVHLFTETAASLAQTFYYRKFQEGGVAIGKHVLLVNPDESTKRSLADALEQVNDVCMVLETGDPRQPETWRLQYVGKFQNNLRVVLDFIRDRKEATSKDIQQQFGVTQGDVQRRLTQLQEDGLVERRKIENSGKKPPNLFTFFHPAMLYLPPEWPHPVSYSVYNPMLADYARDRWEAAVKAITKNELEKAFSCGRESLSAYETLDDDAGTANALWCLGLISRLRADFDTALQYHFQSLALRRQLGDTEAVASSLHNIGVTYAERGDSDETALDYYEQSLAGLTNRAEIAKTLNNMGNLFLHMGRFEEAWEYALRSLRLREEIGNLQHLGSSFCSLGVHAEHRGWWKECVLFSIVGQKLYREADVPLPSNYMHCVMDRLRAARQHLGEEAYALADQTGMTMTRQEAVQYALGL